MSKTKTAMLPELTQEDLVGDTQEQTRWLLLSFSLFVALQGPQSLEEQSSGSRSTFQEVDKVFAALAAVRSLFWRLSGKGRT